MGELRRRRIAVREPGDKKLCGFDWSLVCERKTREVPQANQSVGMSLIWLIKKRVNQYHTSGNVHIKSDSNKTN